MGYCTARRRMEGANRGDNKNQTLNKGMLHGTKVRVTRSDRKGVDSIGETGIMDHKTRNGDGLREHSKKTGEGRSKTP